MRIIRRFPTTLAPLAACLFAAACEPPGVGDPCSPETTPVCVDVPCAPGDEDCRETRPGVWLRRQCDPWAYLEVSVETRSVQCKTRTCMVYHFFPAGRQIGEADWRNCTAPDNPLQRGTGRCEWPPDDTPGAPSPTAPCRHPIGVENFVRKFCKVDRFGNPILNPLVTPDPADDMTPGIFTGDKAGWYCDFNMALVNISQPFCTMKCGGEGRTFDCPEGFTCRGELNLGAVGMRGKYCVPERLVNCDPRRPGTEDCCGTTIR
ncbi:MAG: hypothetical protein QME96_09610 [Myxococcota bacterium]|nr:hypothetical protein [Myxococcota bacterium]